MRKIIFIIAMVIMLSCALVLAVGAESYDKSEAVDVTLANGTVMSCPLYDTEGNALVWYTLDSKATLASVKTSDLLVDVSKGTKLVDATSLTHIYLDANTPLQLHNEHNTNRIVVANFRDCVFKTVSHTSYKTTFGDSNTVEYVYLPSTITNLGCNIFQKCYNLKVCDIPSDASFVISDSNTFPSCTSLREINLVGCTKIVGHSTFSGCTSLTKVVINPATITYATIDDNAYKECPLTQFGLIDGECTIPASTKKIGNACFLRSEFTRLVMSDSVTTIGWNAFASNSDLEEAYISSGLTSIDIRVFQSCTSLSTVIGLESCSIPSIPQEMFLSTAITSISLPESCTSIGTDAFKSCASLVSVTSPSKTMTSIGNNAFYNCSALTSVVLSTTSATTIGGYAFSGCAELTTFTAPGGLGNVGYEAFKACQKLSSGIIIAQGFTSIGQRAFQDCYKMSSLTFLGNAGEDAIINDAAFERCYSIGDVSIPEGVTTINNCAFNHAGVTSLSLPSTLATLSGNSHFCIYGTKATQNGCTVKFITSVTGLENTKITTIPYGMFRGQSSWTDDVARLPDTVTSIGGYGFADCAPKTFILGTGLTTIDGEAFVNCPRIEKVYLPNGLTSVQSNAFNNNKRSNILFFIVSEDEKYISKVQSWGLATSNQAVDYEAYSQNTDGYKSGRYVIYGCNQCDLFFAGAHSIDPTLTTVEYSNGYTSLGVCTTYCKRCLDGFNNDADPLFGLKGWTMAEFADGTLGIGYTVDREAIKFYEETTGKTVSYGMYAVLEARLNGSTIFGENGASSGVSHSDFSSYSYPSFDVKIVGFVTDTHKTASLTMGAYVAVKGKEGTEYSYIENGTPAQGKNYYFFTYDQIITELKLPEAPSEQE